MKYAILILMGCLGFSCHPDLTCAAGQPSDRTLLVYKLDGTKHCESFSGVKLESMKLELTGAGIEVLSCRKGYDGREGIAICGEPTGQINIYEIHSSDLNSALELGFKKLR